VGNPLRKTVSRTIGIVLFIVLGLARTASAQNMRLSQERIALFQERQVRHEAPRRPQLASQQSFT
jgi:hypothetical protein